LEYALAVADELHFGRAAERMHVTQQSVSEQIRRLERELGAPLFTRTSRRVAVTAVGEAFLPAARRAVAASAHARDVGRQAALGLAGEVRVGYAEDIDPQVVRLAAPKLAARTPPVRVAPRPMTTPDQVAALLERRIDAGLGWCPDLPAQLTGLLVQRVRMVAVVPAGHPLAGEEAVDPVRLSQQPLVVVPRAVNPLLHDRIVGQLAARGAAVRIHLEVSSLDRMLPLVLAGAGIGISSPPTAALRPVPGVAYLPFTEPSPVIECRLMWRRDSTDSAVAQLVDVVREIRGVVGPR
jgi:DNA-binding transcriptional LysR family regulator